MGRSILVVLSVACLCLISACGPVYDTQYSFKPPSSEGGRACTFQCNQVKIQCRQIEDLNNSQCEQNSRQDQRDCEAEIRYTKNRSPKWYECGGDSCTSDYESCEATYRSCYESCGGSVMAHTRCVSNCDKIPPAERSRER